MPVSEKKMTTLEKARHKFEQARGELLRQEAKEKQKQKRERRRVIELWGEVAAAALAEGVLTPATWRAHCARYLSHDSQRQLAQAGIEKYAKREEEEAEAPSVTPKTEAL
jgi:hypothetical protein